VCFICLMRKKLGQHFLKDPKTLQRVADGLDLKKGETVIEIGPGHGELTDELRIRNKELEILAIEKDTGLVSYLRKKFSDDKKIEIIEGGALRALPSIIHSSKSQIQGYKLVGNIPYYITGYLFRVIEGLENKPKICVFTIQEEVAERIVAEPPKMNKLSASIQFWAEPEILGMVSRKLFSPPPEVDSAVIKLDVRCRTLDVDRDKYYKMVNILFKQPRKTILNNLSEGFILEKKEIIGKLLELGLDSCLRPQNLSVEMIVRVIEKL